MDRANHVLSLEAQAEKGLGMGKGRLIKIDAGATRPGNTWVEVWRNYGKRARIDCIVDWEKEKVIRARIRAEHGGLPERIPADQEQEYNLKMVEALEKYEDKVPPAMPCEGSIVNESEVRNSLMHDGEA